MAALTQVAVPCTAVSPSACDSPREPCCLLKYPGRRLWAVLVFTHCSAELFGHERGVPKPLVISEFMRKETVKPNQTNWVLFFIMSFWELIKIWKMSESKYLAAKLLQGMALINHFQKGFIKKLNSRSVTEMDLLSDQTAQPNIWTQTLLRAWCTCWSPWKSVCFTKHFPPQSMG